MKNQWQTGNLLCGVVLCQLTMFYLLFLCPVAIFSRCHLRKARETTFILHLSPTRILRMADLYCLLTLLPASRIFSPICFYVLCIYFSLSSRVIFPRFREPNLVFFIVWLAPLSVFHGRVTTSKPGYIPHLLTLWPLLSPLKGSHSIVYFDWAFNLSFVLFLVLRQSHS